jgi:hypothetical protein
VERYLKIAIGVLLGFLFLGSLGAFLLYVPVLPFAAVAVVLLGLILMFTLGLQIGRGTLRISRMRRAMPGAK